MMNRVVGLLIAIALWASPAGAAISLFGSVQTAWSTGAGTTTVNLPNGGSPVGADTIYFIQTVIMNSGTPGTNTPSGWSTFTNSSNNCGVGGMAIFYKTFASGTTPPSNVVVTFADAANTFQGVIATAYQGANISSPIDATGTPSCSATPAATISGPTATTTLNGDQILNFYQIGCGCDVGAGATFGIGTGAIQGQLTRSTTGAEGYAAFGDWNQGAAGATGTNALTWTSGNNEQPLIGMTVALAASTAAIGTQMIGPAQRIGPTQAQ